MVFVPTPRFFFDDESSSDYLYAFNSDEELTPEALRVTFESMGGIETRTVCRLIHDREELCWQFPKEPGKEKYEGTYYQINDAIRHFKISRGEELVGIKDEWKPDMKKGFQERMSEMTKRILYLQRLQTRAYEEDRWLCYDKFGWEYDLQRRIWNRAANRHSEEEYWRNYQKGDLLPDCLEELEKDHLYHDKAYTERKAKSGFQIGTKVKTLIVPKGARTVPVSIGTEGVITEDHGLYWFVEFPLPLVDTDKCEWLPFEEKTTLTIGYTTDEIVKVMEETDECKAC